MAEGYSGNTPGGEQKNHQEELDNFHALKKEFDQGSAQIPLVHDLVCAAGSIGQTRELITWMAQNHGSSTTGLLAIISLLLDMGDKATAEQVVGDAISVHAMYGDYLFHFAEFLVSQKQVCEVLHYYALALLLSPRR